MHLAEATWTDVADSGTNLAVLPVGSTEQHGPHAPLGTDFYAAEAVAAAGADAYDGEVVVAPTLPIGVSAEHRQFPGTLWLDPDTFRAQVRETAESLITHGFRRIAIVNGHGGNVDALREVAADLSRRDDAIAAVFTWFEHVGDESRYMGHAGPLETSIMLATRPELVREDRIEEAARQASDRWGEWVAGVNVAADSAEFTENGVVGDPRDASRERGEKLLERAAGELATLLDGLASRDLETADPKG